MPNYEHFKKYDEWSKQKPAAEPASPPSEPKSGFAKVMRSLKGRGKKT